MAAGYGRSVIREACQRRGRSTQVERELEQTTERYKTVDAVSLQNNSFKACFSDRGFFCGVPAPLPKDSPPQCSRHCKRQQIPSGECWGKDLVRVCPLFEAFSIEIRSPPRAEIRVLQKYTAGNHTRNTAHAKFYW